MHSYRTDVENTFHHITSRGNNKSFIFKDEISKNVFISILKKTLKDFDIQIIAYIIMDNHFHLFIKRNKDSMAKFMHKLLTNFALWYNNHYNHTGHVFERRYFSILVDSLKYLMQVICYIHNNITRLNKNIKIDKYKWSSFKDYISLNDKMVNIDILFKLINFHPKYFVEEFYNYHNKEFKLEYRQIRKHNILGEKDFYEKWMQILKTNKEKRKKIDRKKINPKFIFDFIEHNYSIKISKSKKKTKNFKYNQIKQITYYLLNKFCHLKITEISKMFELSHSCVSKNIKTIKNNSENIDKIFLLYIKKFN